MPMYSYRCWYCGNTSTEFRKIDDRNNAPKCHLAMRRVIEAPAVQTDIPSYQSPIDGRWIDGRRARAEDLKRSGCRPWEGMDAERKEATKRADESDRIFDQKTEAAVHETFNGMGAEKQRILSSV